MSDTTLEKGRGEIEDLLPWYANGRLSAAERTRVEAAVAADPELARRLDLVIEEMAEAIAVAEALPAPTGRALDRLMAAIDAEPVRARPFAAAKAGLIDRLGGLVASLTPRRLAYASLAAAALVFVQAAVLTGLVGERVGGGAGPYGTASQEQTTATGPSLLVAFVPGVRLDDVAGLLKRAGVQVAEGPKANGFFRLRLAAPGDAARLAAAAAALKAETGLVAFVQATP